MKSPVVHLASLPPVQREQIPTAERPVTVRARTLPADTHLEPHRHPWAQLAYCASGVMQVEVGEAQRTTYTVPPSRAVWIAPQRLHAVLTLERAELRTLYIDPGSAPPDWDASRVLIVTPLLRELIDALDAPRAGREPERRGALARLILDEIAHAPTQRLGVRLPQDKRLRALCEDVLRDPAGAPGLAELAAKVGASTRTVARLFHAELGVGYQQWRQDALLAHALIHASRGRPLGWIAAELGYSPSAFSAMVKRAVGQSPRAFFGR
jgi:AraC-like DNA-binding protein/quercetin dioxygenase-like cupin family protein